MDPNNDNENLFAVLQNIEAVVADEFSNDESLTDYSVMAIYEALINAYTAEITKRTPRPVKLSAAEQTLRDDIKIICEWRLGRGNLDDASDLPELEIEPYTLEEMLIALKKLFKSVKFWNKENGSQGYLKYISHFV
jgi:hypothetical protein